MIDRDAEHTMKTNQQTTTAAQVDTDNLERLRYPVGRVPRGNAPADAQSRADYLDVLEKLPAAVRSLVTGLSDAQLDTPYRPGGWTIRQLVHHLPDSHLNAYVRMKLAATEDSPQIKTYEEARWAELPEAKNGPIAMSLDLLDALHRRWVAFLRALPEAQWRRPFSHPEWGVVPIEESLMMYAWHCRHHTEHLRRGTGR
jgi:hypothetical protein